MTLGVSSRASITDDRPRGLDPTQTHFEPNLKTSVSSVSPRVLRATPFLHLNCVTSKLQGKAGTVYLLDLDEAASGGEMDPGGVDRRGMAGGTIGC